MYYNTPNHNSERNREEKLIVTRTQTYSKVVWYKQCRLTKWCLCLYKYRLTERNLLWFCLPRTVGSYNDHQHQSISHQTLRGAQFDHVTANLGLRTQERNAPTLFLRYREVTGVTEGTVINSVRSYRIVWARDRGLYTREGSRGTSLWVCGGRSWKHCGNETKCMVV